MGTSGTGDRSKVVTSGFCLGSGKCMVEWRSGRLIDWAPSSAYWMLDCGGFLCQCWTVARRLCACGVVGLIGSGGAKERLLAVGGSVGGDEQCSGVGAVGSFDSVGVITTGLGLEMRTAVMLTEEVPGNSTGVLTC